MDTLKGLKATKKLLSVRSRWGKKNMRMITGKTTSYCLIGGLRTANKVSCWSPITDVNNDQYVALNNALPKKWRASTTDTDNIKSCLIEYNDNSRRKHSEILNLLSRAIKGVDKHVGKGR